MTIDYTIHLESEYHIGTGLHRPGVVDSTLVTRPDGSLVIPGEHFRGILRDACTQILHWLGRADACCEASLQKGPRRTEVLTTCGLNHSNGDSRCVLCRLFGTTFTPRRYHFSDAVLTEESKTALKDKETRRVSMHNRVDAATGRVAEETFFAFELGSKASFQGRIERAVPSADPAQLHEEVGLLLAGLRLVERVGGKSGRGWGHALVKATCLSGVTPPAGIVSEPNDAVVDGWLEWYIRPAAAEGGPS